MRKSRFSEEQIVGILKEHAAGEAHGALCRRHGISQQTLYRWKQQVRRLGRNEAQTAQGAGGGERPPQAPGRRAGPGQPGAQGAAPKKLVTPAQRRAAVGYAAGAVRLLAAAGLSAGGRRRARRSATGGGAADDDRAAARLRELAAQRPRFGYRRLHVLLRREGIVVNHKRIERLYREEGLAVRRRRRKARGRAIRRGRPRAPAAAPTSSGRSTSCRMRWPRGGRSACSASSMSSPGRRWPSRSTPACQAGGWCACWSGSRPSGGVPTQLVLDNGPELIRPRSGAVGARARGRAALHRPRQADPERLLRELPRSAARRMPQRALVPRPRRCAPDRGGVAAGLQSASGPTARSATRRRRSSRSGRYEQPRRCRQERRTLIMLGPNNGGRSRCIATKLSHQIWLVVRARLFPLAISLRRREPIGEFQVDFPL